MSMKKHTRRGGHSKNSIFQEVQSISGVSAVNWSSSSANQFIVFGPGLCQAFDQVLPNWNYYKIKRCTYYVSVPSAFEHVNLAVAAIPYSVGPPVGIFGELLAKPGAFMHSLQSRQPSCGLQNIPSWQKKGHHVPRSVLISTPERMFASNVSALDTSPYQFVIVIAPDVTVSNSSVLVHYNFEVEFSSRTESGVQKSVIKQQVLTDLSRLPIKEVLSKLEQIKEEGEKDKSSTPAVQSSTKQ